MARRRLRRGLGCISALLGFLASLLLSLPVAAQSVPPVFPAVDERGVDVTSGSFTFSQTDVAIGPPGDGLDFTRFYRSPLSWTSNHNSFIYTSGTTCKVVLANRTETFASSGDCLGTFTSQQQMGSTLTYNTSTKIYTYTLRDATIVTFSRLDPPNVVVEVGGSLVRGYITSVTRPSGEVTTYVYDWEPTCWPDWAMCYEYWETRRLRTIYNNLGYRLWLDYPNPSPASLVRFNKVTGVNNAVEYCVPPSCSQPWPTATYTRHSSTSSKLLSMTNALGQTTSYIYESIPSMQITELQFPDDVDHDVNVTYTSNKVSSVDTGYGTWSYAFDDFTDRRATVTDPASKTRIYWSNIATGRIKTITNELGYTLSYLYDSAQRQVKVTLPEGNYVQYTYLCSCQPRAA